MSIFGDIAKAFRGSKEPTPAQIRTLLAKADAAVAAAETEVAAVEARLPEAVMSGEEGVAAHREATRKASEELDYAREAHKVLASKLAAAEAQEAESARCARYAAAVAAQKAAAADLLATYPSAIAELRRLQAAVAEADRLAEAANSDLPQGAERLIETEAVRDVPATPERIVSEELIDQWVTEAGTPVDAARVTRREGKRGALYAESSFGPRPVACELVKMRRVVRQPWCPPSYASRIGDLELPSLRAEPVPTPQPVEELVPVAEIAEAAE